MRRQATLRRDDRHPIPVVEIERGIPPRLARARPPRLEQRRRERSRAAEAAPREPEQMRVELPRDLHREPRARPRGGQARHGEIQATSTLIRVYVAHWTRRDRTL